MRKFKELVIILCWICSLHLLGNDFNTVLQKLETAQTLQVKNKLLKDISKDHKLNKDDQDSLINFLIKDYFETVKELDSVNISQEQEEKKYKIAVISFFAVAEQQNNPKAKEFLLSIEKGNDEFSKGILKSTNDFIEKDRRHEEEIISKSLLTLKLEALNVDELLSKFETALSEKLMPEGEKLVIFSILGRRINIENQFTPKKIIATGLMDKYFNEFYSDDQSSVQIAVLNLYCSTASNDETLNLLSKLISDDKYSSIVRQKAEDKLKFFNE